MTVTFSIQPGQEAVLQGHTMKYLGEVDGYHQFSGPGRSAQFTPEAVVRAIEDGSLVIRRRRREA